MRIGEIRPAAGSTKTRKRRGKGKATGVGGTAGKGHKGHKARSGGSIPSWFEGGQMAIYRRLPKRGFKNIHRVEVQEVAVERLNAADAGSVVDAAWLREKRIVRRPGPVKVLGGGELKHAVKLRVDAISAGARKIVEAAGGSIELIEPRPKYVKGGAKAPSKSEKAPAEKAEAGTDSEA